MFDRQSAFVRLKGGFGGRTVKSSQKRTPDEGGQCSSRELWSGPYLSQFKLSPSKYFSAKIEDYSMAPRATLHYDQIAIPSQPPNVTIPPNAVIDPSHLVPSSAPPHFSTTVTSTPQRVVANSPQKKMVMSFEMENERKHAPEYVYSPGSSPEPSPAPSNDQKPDIIE